LLPVELILKAGSHAGFAMIFALLFAACESSKLNPPPSLRSGSRSDVYRQFITKEIISSRLVSYFKLFGRGPGWAAVGRSILEATANQPRWSDRTTLRLTSC
jgi:hypothetical protein